jgi:hypothetical protein
VLYIKISPSRTNISLNVLEEYIFR